LSDFLFPVNFFSALIEILPVLKESCKDFRCFRSQIGSGLSNEIRSILAESVDLDAELKSVKDCPEPESIAKSIHVTDPLLFIYTSGTTGLPKAVIIKHIR
jgi:acyl-coenzyme A synthetase/AMP-(fatty) acid ligase